MMPRQRLTMERHTIAGFQEALSQRASAARLAFHRRCSPHRISRPTESHRERAGARARPVVRIRPASGPAPPRHFLRVSAAIRSNRLRGGVNKRRLRKAAEFVPMRSVNNVSAVSARCSAVRCSPGGAGSFSMSAGNASQSRGGARPMTESRRLLIRLSSAVGVALITTVSVAPSGA